MRAFLNPAAAMLTVVLSGCTTLYPPAPMKGHSPAPAGLAEELHQSVTHLAVTIGERNCYHPAKLTQAADWIEAQFHAMGYVTRRMPVAVPAGPPYFCGRQTVWNVEADKSGTDLKNEIVVIGAHYDSKVAMAHWHDDGPPLPQNPGTPGADDNASGVAGVLAVARLLKDRPLRRTVKFVAFVNEEPPFFQTCAMGSYAYARALAKENASQKCAGRKITGMISFEMLGYYARSDQAKRPFAVGVTGLTSEPDYLAFLGDLSSGDFSNACGEVFSRHAPIAVRVSRVPVIHPSIAWSDDWSFWQIHVPAFSATDTAFLRNDHYHDVSDTPDTLDYPKMADTVWGLRFVVETLGTVQRD
ncbi:MAG: peptidase [Phycisphaerales bacterium]|nr:peptidase [Phycisphaerales bacterium]